MNVRLLGAVAALGTALLAAPAHGAKFVNGTPDFAKLKGKPTTIMFFHPL
jgi:hypothetical protein